MSNVHVYIAVENLAMNASQRAALHDVLKILGIAPNSPQPALRNHWRKRLDGDAYIYEALFDEDNLTVAIFKEYMADAFGVDASDIDHTRAPSQYGDVFTFRYVPNDTKYFRMVAFGLDNGGWPTWAESRVIALQYLTDFASEWEPEEE